MSSLHLPSIRFGIPLLAAAAAATLAGCTVGPDYKPPATTMPAAYAATQPTTLPVAGAPVELERWWTVFGDPTLDRLVADAARSNIDLALAAARLRESRALRAAAAAQQYPAVNTTGAFTRSRTSENTFGGFSGASRSTGSTGQAGGTGAAGGGSSAVAGAFNEPGSEQSFYQAGFDANWEVDLWGRVRRNVEAADAEVAAAVEDRRDVLVTLLAEVARNYVELRAAQERADITRRNIASQTDTLKLTQARLEAGLIDELDVVLAKAQVAQTTSTLPALDNAASQARHRLAVLVGTAPESLPTELASALGAAGHIPAAAPTVPAGLPAELLRRRPDIRRAERQLAAATARIGVAQADLYPRLSLAGSLGFQSSKPANFFSLASRFWSIGPSLSWALFDAGKIRANIAAAGARQEQALLTYDKAVLTALEDVENALVAYNTEVARRRSLVESVMQNRRAVELARLKYPRIVNFLTVLEAERSLYQAEDQLAQSDSALSNALVALYKALGGGWDEKKD